MSPQTREEWQDLAGIWKTGSVPFTGEEIERLQERQHRRLQIARVGELACASLGVVAAVWLALASRFLWVGILTAAFSVAAVFFVLRARRQPASPGSTGLLESLQDSLAYQEWLAEQLRYGRVLGFVALFAVVMAASTQLMNLAAATRSGLIATATAGIAIGAALAWNMGLAWQAWRRTARLKGFRKELMTEQMELEDSIS